MIRNNELLFISYLECTKALESSRRMIVSFRDEWLRAFLVEDQRSRHIPPDLESRLFRRLQMIDDATTDHDLRARRAITSRSCGAAWQGSTEFGSTTSGG